MGKNPMGVIGPLWMGGVLLALILSAFLDGAFQFLSGLNILTHLLLFWGAMTPGVIMCVMAANKTD